MADTTAEVIRNTDGRFVMGHKYVGGSMLAAERNRRIDLVARATTDDEVLAVWNRIKADAMDGSVPDKQMFLAYLLGKPDAMDPKEAVRQYDAINLNKPASELTMEQIAQRRAFLMAQEAQENESH